MGIWDLLVVVWPCGKEGVVMTVGLEACGIDTVKRSETVKWWSTDYFALLQLLQLKNREL